MVIVIDPFVAGISGDMVLCSLVDLGANGNKIIRGVKSCEKFLPGSILKKIDFTKINKHGIDSTGLLLEIEEKSHERTGLELKQALTQSIEELHLSENAKNFTTSCIDTLIFAESKIHGIPKESVLFHEASSIDTLVDILGVAIAIDDLGIFDEKIVSMPIGVGGGTVNFSHGTMTNPASAVLEILKNTNLKIHGGIVKSELTTPTGVSILVNLTNTSIEYYPSMKIDSIGYGAGKKDFDNFSNVLKIVKGNEKNLDSDFVINLETNVDDVSGEILGNLIETIMKVGAKDVSIYHGITKKGRPTNLISVICNNDTIDKITETLISETGTLGIRVSSSERIIVPRTIHETQIFLGDKSFKVKYKISSFKGKSSFKIEFDDVKKIATSLDKSIKETDSLIRNEILKEDV